MTPRNWSTGQIKTVRTVAYCLIAATWAGFVVLPIFWPVPSSVVKMPATAPCTEDLSFEVLISSWHSNYEVNTVRFYVDDYKSSAVDPAKPFYALIIYEGPSTRRNGGWPSLTLNRFTYPRTHSIRLTVPLANLQQQGIVHPGILKGTVDVSTSYPNMRPRSSLRRGWVNVGTATEQVPFEVQLS